MAICADGADEVDCEEASMVRAVFLWLVVVGSLVACAGERKPNALVRSENYGAEDATMAKNYNLVFSVIDVKANGSGQTSVEVKLRSGNMVVTNGKAARSEVELQYLTSNDSGPSEFTAIKKLKMSRGTVTFNVTLPIGRAQVQAVTEIEAGNSISTESGIFEVLPATSEDDEDL